MHAPAAPLIGLRLVAFDAQNGHRVALRLQPLDKRRVEQQPIGHQEEYDVGEVPGDVHDFRPRERLAARDHEKGDAQLVRLRHNAAQLVEVVPPDRGEHGEGECRQLLPMGRVRLELFSRPDSNQGMVRSHGPIRR